MAFIDAACVPDLTQYLSWSAVDIQFLVLDCVVFQSL